MNEDYALAPATPAVDGEREVLIAALLDMEGKLPAYCFTVIREAARLLAQPTSLLRRRESVREIAHKYCTCTCRGGPAVLQNHTNLCDSISDAILEYAGSEP